MNTLLLHSFDNGGVLVVLEMNKLSVDLHQATRFDLSGFREEPNPFPGNPARAGMEFLTFHFFKSRWDLTFMRASFFLAPPKNINKLKEHSI